MSYPSPYQPPNWPSDPSNQQQPQIIILQQPQAPAPLPYRGPPKDFWSGWGALGWMLAISVGVSAVGSIAFYGAIAYGVWDVTSSINEAVEENSELRADRMKSARQFAKNRLSDYGITQISNEAELLLDGQFVSLSGTAQHRTGNIYPYFIRWRVATFGKQTKWDIQELVLDGELREH